MQDEPARAADTVDIDGHMYIALERGREWPKYVVSWAVRRRDAQQDYPVATGAVADLPSGAQTPDELWESLRAQALEQAQNAAAAQSVTARRRSFLSRLFGR